MTIRHLALLWAAILCMATAEPAAAYIGPGAGAGTIAVVLGILAAVVMAVLAAVWYPVKRLIAAARSTRPQAGSPAETPGE